MFRIVLIIISLLVSQISGAQEIKTEQSGDYPELATKAKEHLEELEKTATIAQVHPFLMNIFVPQNQKFLKNWNSYSPTLEIAKLKTPVSIIQGEAHLQVGLEDALVNHVLKMVNNTTKINNDITAHSFRCRLN